MDAINDCLSESYQPSPPSLKPSPTCTNPHQPSPALIKPATHPPLPSKVPPPPIGSVSNGLVDMMREVARPLDRICWRLVRLARGHYTHRCFPTKGAKWARAFVMGNNLLWPSHNMAPWRKIQTEGNSMLGDACQSFFDGLNQDTESCAESHQQSDEKNDCSGPIPRLKVFSLG